VEGSLEDEDGERRKDDSQGVQGGIVFAVRRTLTALMAVSLSAGYL
jgi:hypothetical protein